ncbi:MAG: Uma2 family endonuclease [Thermoleophilaceae bacterium]
MTRSTPTRCRPSAGQGGGIPLRSARLPVTRGFLPLPDPGGAAGCPVAPPGTRPGGSPTRSLREPASGDRAPRHRGRADLAGARRGPKAELYASAGIPELWVVDVPGRRVGVHRAPRPTGYSAVEDATRGELVAAGLAGGPRIDVEELFAVLVETA